MAKVIVRTSMSEGNYSDLEFERVPGVGEAVFMPVGRGEPDEAWIVTAVGHRFVDLTKTALPVIELELFEEDAPPPNRYDRMIAGR